jgi:hypothetical protein
MEGAKKKLQNLFQFTSSCRLFNITICNFDPYWQTLCMVWCKFIERKEGVFPPAIGGTAWRVAVGAFCSELHYELVPTDVPAVTTLRQSGGNIGRTVRAQSKISLRSGGASGEAAVAHCLLALCCNDVSVTETGYSNRGTGSRPLNWYTNILTFVVSHNAVTSRTICFIFGRSQVRIFGSKVWFLCIFRQFLQEYIETVPQSCS